MDGWYRDEISGPDCAKNIWQLLAGSAGGATVGGVIGATVGGPAGAAAGAAVGGYMGYAFVNQCHYKFMCDLFESMNKEDATAMAFHFFGLSPSASNAEINEAYRQMEAEFKYNHVNEEKLFKLKLYMLVIINSKKA